MNIDDIKNHFKVKTARELAAKLGKSQGLMTYWKNKGVPYEQQCVLYYESKHKLKPSRDNNE